MQTTKVSDSFVVVDKEFMEIALENMKRVQELEEENVILKATRAGNEEHIDVLHKQNKRYREAIEKALEEEEQNLEGYQSSVYRILNEALEGEE